MERGAGRLAAGTRAASSKRRGANKPVCLVFYTTWCPHCRNYSHVFDDPRVVERARDFVMVRLDADAEATVAAKYQVDGGYIPRTYFPHLAPTARLDKTIHAPRARSQYFYDERDQQGSLLAGMSAALQNSFTRQRRARAHARAWIFRAVVASTPRSRTCPILDETPCSICYGHT